MTTTTRWFAFLRAINVGGHAVVKMAELRAALERAGFGGVSTHLQSGNLALDASDATESDVARGIADVLAHGFGIETAVLVRSAAELRDVLARVPFAPDADPKQVLVHLFDAPLDADTANTLAGWSGPESLVGDGRELYVHYPAGIGRSKLTAFAPFRALQPRSTARNLNTLRALS